MPVKAARRGPARNKKSKLGKSQKGVIEPSSNEALPRHLGEIVWSTRQFRRGLLDVLDDMTLFNMLCLDKDTFHAAIEVFWREVTPAFLQNLSVTTAHDPSVLISRNISIMGSTPVYLKSKRVDGINVIVLTFEVGQGRRSLYKDAVRTLDLRGIDRGEDTFNDLKPLIERLPNIRCVYTQWTTIDIVHPPGSPDPQGSTQVSITMERIRDIPGLQTPQKQSQKAIARQFPAHWKINRHFKLGIRDLAFQKIDWSDQDKKSSFDLGAALSSLKGNLAESIPSLTIWAPISIKHVGEYHQSRMKRGLSLTRHYTIHTHGYQIQDLKMFALATMGTIDSLTLRVHANWDAELTLHQLLCEMDWNWFYSLRELDITVQPPEPTPGVPIEPGFPFTSPETPPSFLAPVHSGAPLQLRSFIVRFHWTPETHTAPKFPRVAMSQLALAVLRIGGPGCDYSIAFSDDCWDNQAPDVGVAGEISESGLIREGLSGWLTESLRAEISQIVESTWWSGGKGWCQHPKEDRSVSSRTRRMSEIFDMANTVWED